MSAQDEDLGTQFDGPQPPSWPPSPLLVRVFRDPVPDADELAGRLRDRFTVVGFDGFEIPEAENPPVAQDPADELATLLPAWLGQASETTQEALAAAARTPAPTILPMTSSELAAARMNRARRATLVGRTAIHEARRRRINRRARGQVLGLATTISLALLGASAAAIAAVAIQNGVYGSDAVASAGGFPNAAFLGQEKTFARSFPATAFLREASTLSSAPPGGWVVARAEDAGLRAEDAAQSKPAAGSSDDSVPSASSDGESAGSSSDGDSSGGSSKPERSAPKPRSAPAPASSPPPRRSGPAPAPRRQSAPAPRRQSAPAPRRQPAPAPRPQPQIQPADPPPRGGGDPSLGSTPSL